MLVIGCVDESGAPVAVSKAELLVSGWGYAASVPLKTDGGTVTMPLDEAAVRSLVGDDPAQIEELYLYVQAEGYAPVRSAAIRLSGVDGTAVTEADAVAAFAHTGGTAVRHGDVIDAKARLRRPEPRFLRLLDDDGRPVAGVPVLAYMYWSSANHCARLAGAERIADTKSGPDGLAAIPDGDIVYAFEIAAGDMGLVLQDPELTEYPERLVTELHGETTVVRLHRRKTASLSMRVMKGGAPAVGETLYGCMADCPGGVCASCCGPLAATGADGMITLPGFYPEAYSRIYFQDSDGGVIYEADPGMLSWEGPMDVELGGCQGLGGGR